MALVNQEAAGVGFVGGNTNVSRIRMHEAANPSKRKPGQRSSCSRPGPHTSARHGEHQTWVVRRDRTTSTFQDARGASQRYRRAQLQGRTKASYRLIRKLQNY